jgi:hypothetical protein
MGRVGGTIKTTSRYSIIWKPQSRTVGCVGAGGAAIAVPSMGGVSSAFGVIRKPLIIWQDKRKTFKAVYSYAE